ncbi:hypothetical protein Patl1_03346 [Pistacia atlantica]|uniref:Uncharacterized protein n=1 Tax=Pistacia atlantica TaxID=434234 RepID=A0ACC1CBH1_9ROSI|nr:hypothetical protein Patl1_03346 [Pistacia atlantica]
MKAGHLVSEGSGEGHSTVTDLSTVQDSQLVAVAIQRQDSSLICALQGILLLSCNISAQTLYFAKVVSIKGENFIPTSLGSSSSVGLLWMVTGVSNVPGFDYSSLSRVKVISGFNKNSADSVENEPTVLEDNDIPGGMELLKKLQGSVCVEEKVFLAAAEAVKTSMCNLLIKKQYSSEKREFRKRTRNDRKTKQ